MLLTLDDFCQKYFSDESRPTKRQIYYWVRRQYIPTRRIGSRIFVETDKLDTTTGFKYVDKILQGK